MQFEFNTRHFALEDESRDRIEKRIAKLERYSPRNPVSIRLTITKEGGRFEAELSYYLRNTDFHAKAERTEPDLAADEAIESLERQLRRFKDRVANRDKGEEGSAGLGEAMAAAGLLASEGAVLDEAGFRLKDLSVEAAVEAFRDSQYPFLVFRNRDSSRVAVVYRREEGTYGLLEQRED